MSIDSMSVQFSASYGSVSYTARPLDGKTLSFDNTVSIIDSLEIRKTTWEDLVGLQTTNVVDEDGIITRTMTGSTSFLGAERRGSTLFSVSLTFDSNTREGGDMSPPPEGMIRSSRKAVRPVICACQQF